jgi:hypothetical protein
MNLSISSLGVASGPDAAFVLSVAKGGTGIYIITLKESAKIAPHVSGITLLAATATGYNSAVTVNSITINTALAGVAADTAFNVQLQFSEQLAYYF